MRDKTCCFTGHRDLPADLVLEIRARTESAIRKLIIEHGARYYGVGGALGYDALAADILFRLRDTEYPYIRVILVYTFEGFIERWGEHERLRYERTLPKYDKRVCVSQRPSREAYLARDRHLVDHANYCIAYCVRDSGGTAYTVRYAQRKGLIIENVAN